MLLVDGSASVPRAGFADALTFSSQVVDTLSSTSSSTKYVCVRSLLLCPPRCVGRMVRYGSPGARAPTRPLAIGNLPDWKSAGKPLCKGV